MPPYSTLVSAERTCHTIEIREKETELKALQAPKATWWPFSTVPMTAATIRSSPPSSSTESLKSQRVFRFDILGSFNTMFFFHRLRAVF